MKIKLVFDDWIDKDGKSIYRTEKGFDLSIGHFHSGTTFDGEIVLDEDDEAELRSALEEGYTPQFSVWKEAKPEEYED